MEERTRPLTIAVASRPYPNEIVNGDDWTVQWSGDACRIAVIDGLGHGPEAAAASGLARATLAASPDLPPVDAIIECHHALVGTRGAAMSVARICLTSGTLTYAGIGNVEAQHWNGQRVRRPIAHRGIVGRSVPTPRQQVLHLGEPDWSFLIYSDGIRERFDLPTLADFERRDAQSLADVILSEWSRPTDDATVVVVMPRGGAEHSIARNRNRP